MLSYKIVFDINQVVSWWHGFFSALTQPLLSIFMRVVVIQYRLVRRCWGICWGWYQGCLISSNWGVVRGCVRVMRREEGGRRAVEEFAHRIRRRFNSTCSCLNYLLNWYKILNKFKAKILLKSENNINKSLNIPSIKGIRLFYLSELLYIQLLARGSQKGLQLQKIFRLF